MIIGVTLPKKGQMVRFKKLLRLYELGKLEQVREYILKKFAEGEDDDFFDEGRNYHIVRLVNDEDWLFYFLKSNAIADRTKSLDYFDCEQSREWYKYFEKMVEREQQIKLIPIEVSYLEDKKIHGAKQPKIYRITATSQICWKHSKNMEK